jgi:hypothetical protein
LKGKKKCASKCHEKCDDINPKSNKMDMGFISMLLKLDLQHQIKNHGM